MALDCIETFWYYIFHLCLYLLLKTQNYSQECLYKKYIGKSPQGKYLGAMILLRINLSVLSYRSNRLHTTRVYNTSLH